LVVQSIVGRTRLPDVRLPHYMNHLLAEKLVVINSMKSICIITVQFF